MGVQREAELRYLQDDLLIGPVDVGTPDRRGNLEQGSSSVLEIR